MRRIAVSLVAAAALGGTAIQTASAADLRTVPVKAPPPAVVAVYDWSGCYVGFFGGYKTGRVHHAIAGLDDFSRYNLRGGVVGGDLGCNFQRGALVYGIEGDIAWLGATGNGNPPNPAFTLNARERWLATLRGRLGFAMNQWLFYATGGVAFSSLRVTETAPNGTSMQDSQSSVGWVVGLGTEYALNQNWRLKAEYLYADFGNETFFNGVTACTGCTTPQQIEWHNHILKFGVNYRF